MSRTKVCSMALAVAVAFLLSGCSQTAGDAPASGKSQTAAGMNDPASHGSLKITQWGPQETAAGTAFNAQPDGSSALWIRVDQSLDGTDSAVTMDGAALHSSISGQLITAGVPASFYAASGVHNVAVVMKKGAEEVRSDNVQFTVK